MIQLSRNYCEQAAFYGIKDLFYARSKFTKIFWTLILIIAIGMTIFQMYYVVKNFIASPTKTEISLLPSNVEPKYPPFYFAVSDFTEWVDLSKIKTFGFDLGTFFYFMSYFCPIYTRFHFDVAAAERNLWQIMKKQNISSLYDLAIEVSASKPLSLVNYTDNFSYFSRVITGWDEGMYYISNVKFTEKEPSVLEFVTTSSFVHTKFYSEFKYLFNYSLTEEYKYLQKRFYETEYVVDDESDLKIPFFCNPVGTTDLTDAMDIFTSSYQFFMSGTLYKWQPTTERPCDDSVDSQFEIECFLECTHMFKDYSIRNCSLYFNETIEDNDKWNQQTCLYNLSFFGNINVSYTDDSLELCKKRCLNRSCKEWKYNSQLTMNINNGILKPGNNMDKSNGTITLLCENKQKILVISETPTTTWNDALASTGGLLGLWLGGSIVSFVQIFYICCCMPLESWFIDRNKGVERIHSTTAMRQVEKRPNKPCRYENNRNGQCGPTMPQSFFLSKREELENVQFRRQMKFLDEKMKNIEVKLNHLLKEHKI